MPCMAFIAMAFPVWEHGLQVCRFQQLQHVGSRTPQLIHCGAPVCCPTCPQLPQLACGIFSALGSTPCPLHWQGFSTRFSSSGPPGKSLDVLTWMTVANEFLKFPVWVQHRKEFLHVFKYTKWVLTVPNVTDVFLQKMEKIKCQEDSMLADKASRSQFNFLICYLLHLISDEVEMRGLRFSTYCPWHVDTSLETLR